MLTFDSVSSAFRASGTRSLFVNPDTLAELMHKFVFVLQFPEQFRACRTLLQVRGTCNPPEDRKLMMTVKLQILFCVVFHVFILLSAKSDFNAPVLSAVRLTVQTAVSPPAEGISEPFLRWVCRVCPRAEASRVCAGLG